MLDQEPVEGVADLLALTTTRPRRAERDLAPDLVDVRHQRVDDLGAGAPGHRLVAAADPVGQRVDDVAEPLGLRGRALGAGLAVEEPLGRARGEAGEGAGRDHHRLVDGPEGLVSGRPGAGAPPGRWVGAGHADRARAVLAGEPRKADAPRRRGGARDCARRRRTPQLGHETGQRQRSGRPPLDVEDAVAVVVGVELGQEPRRLLTLVVGRRHGGHDQAARARVQAT